MLKEKINADLLGAVKKNDELERSVLRMLNAAILNLEKEKRFKIAKTDPSLSEKDLEEKSKLSDEEIVETIFSEIKKREEAILGFSKGNRPELAAKEKNEEELLKRYLPALLSEEEIKELAKEAIAKIGAKEIRDMGRVLAEMAPQVKGKTDNSLVSMVVKELLSRKEI
ncbi:MAG: GatB/YqeY domain-containing protein [bacterium]